ncbi:MAG: CBS domain-containing protein [Nitrospira sp.]|nr:CBS domain-containing protein [Nitrospira sp.]
MNQHGGGAAKDFMHRYLEVVLQDTTAAAAAERMVVKQIGCLLVESHDPERGMFGILTETDLVRKVLAQGLDPTVTMVDRVMASPILTIAGDRSMLDASHLMETNHVRHLCVAEAGEIVGIISVRDLVRSFVDAASGPVCELDKVYRPLSVLMATTLATIQSDASLLAAAQLMGDRILSVLPGLVIARSDF